MDTQLWRPRLQQMLDQFWNSEEKFRAACCRVCGIWFGIAPGGRLLVVCADCEAWGIDEAKWINEFRRLQRMKERLGSHYREWRKQ